jgi:hypothetical protein
MTVISDRGGLFGLRHGPAFFGGGPYNVTASVNVFTEAVA